MKFAIVAKDPQVDIYRESDLYGVEVVECESQHEVWFHATEFHEFGMGLQFVIIEVTDATEIGWHDNLDDIEPKEPTHA